MADKGGWQTPKRRKGTLSDKLLELSINTGKHHILEMARKAKAGALGEAGVAKAWRLLGQRHRHNAAADERVHAAERRAKVLEARLKTLEEQQQGSRCGIAPQIGSSAPPPVSERRPAPEVVTAQAESRAAELEQAATRLKAVGLAEDAEKLLEKAAAQRKQVEKAPTPWKRIEALEGFITRAEARVTKAQQRIDTIEDELAKARQSRDTLKQELDDARQQLTELRNSIAPDDKERAPSLVSRAQELLEAMESSSALATSGLPEPVLDRMRKLHVLLGNVRMDKAEEPEVAESRTSITPTALAEAEPELEDTGGAGVEAAADALMEQLNELHHGDASSEASEAARRIIRESLASMAKGRGKGSRYEPA